MSGSGRESVPERAEVDPGRLKAMSPSGRGWVQGDVYFCLGKRDAREFKMSRHIVLGRSRGVCKALEVERSGEV